MNGKLIKTYQLIGLQSYVYSVYLDNEERTLFERFIEENIISFKSEINDIVQHLRTIGTKTGARE